MNRIPAGISSFLIVLGSAAPAVFAGDPPLTTQLVAGGLASPIEITHAPRDFTRLFVLERSGRVRLIKNGVLQTTPFLDITGQVNTVFERGLLGIDFHPNYAANGYFYIRYNNTSGQHVVRRFSVSANPDLANATSGFTLLTIANNASNHNGGSIEFGPDGYLYMTIGDDASSGNAQDITQQLHGKVLRLDVNGDDFPADPARNYAIPLSNPFAGAITGDDEIWALGLRNPFRAGFDRLTGEYWIGDVGAGAIEEIDIQPAVNGGGRNYGWPCMEGLTCTGNTSCVCNSPALTLPIWQYTHAFGCAVTGGRVYRGCAMPALQGTYFCGDYCSSRIWSFRYENGQIVNLQERQVELDPPGALTIGSPVAFGEDAFGEIYICDLGGEVYKIVPATPGPDKNGNGVPDICEPAGDVNGDFVVDVNDLLAVVGAWGPCPAPCPPDLNGDGVVDVNDLLTVIGTWT